MKRHTLVVLVLWGCDESTVVQPLDVSWNRMLEQPRADAYDPSSVFADGKTMQSPPNGTFPHDARNLHPPVVDRTLLELGHARFETFCAACHGILGDGMSAVAGKMMLRRPPSLHEPRLRVLEPLAIEAVIERGFGLMPSYADALEPRERAAVSHYVKALQIARGATAAELPPAMRAELLGNGGAK
jgi:mono/diheme cytochrome c family protein